MPRLLLAAGAVVFLIAVTGCEGAAPHVTVGSTPSSTPVFASDEEALAAAEAAYGAYLEVADQVFAEGGTNPERLASVSTGDQLRLDVDGFRDVARLGQRGIGATVFRDVVLQRYEPVSSMRTVVVYLCEDITDVDVLDSDGTSLVTPSRPNLVTYEVSFDLDYRSVLLVSDKQAWEESC